MRLSRALYRLTVGTTIHQTDYNYDTGELGNYTIPTILLYDDTRVALGAAYWEKLYEVMLRDPDVIACIDYMGECVYAVTPTHMYGVGIKDTFYTYPMYEFHTPITKDIWYHIGYVKKPDENIIVTKPIPRIVTNSAGITNIPGFTVDLTKYQIGPHINLYKALLSNKTANAVLIQKDGTIDYKNFRKEVL